MKQGSERRLSKRRVFDQPLSFEIMGEGIEIIKKDATGINISTGGLGMTTEYALKKRDILRLYIPA